MFLMKDRDLVSACKFLEAVLGNKDNWVIRQDKSLVIKIKGIREPLAAKVSHISTVGDTVFLSIAAVRRYFSFRKMRFIPYVAVMNVPVTSIEYIMNPMPEIGERESEEDKNEEEIGYIG